MFNSGWANYCDRSDGNTSPDWKGPGWYRLIGAAGTSIPEMAYGANHCGTLYPGWMRGVHPSIPGDTVVAEVCFHGGVHGDCRYPVNIIVTNCGDYYLYELPETPYCDMRYCGK